MILPTEPIGSIPRSHWLIEAAKKSAGEDPKLNFLFDEATRDTIERFEATGSPVITDGEQRKYQNFATYSVHGLPNIIRDNLQSGQTVFLGVVDPITPRIETPEEIRNSILEAAKYIPVDQLGTTDDCGFSPFCDDTSTTRDTAFAKIQARVEGPLLASQAIIEGR